MRNDYAAGVINAQTYEGSIVLASFTLMAVALSIFIVIHFLAPRLKLPVRRYWPTFERKLSYSEASLSRNSIALPIFFVIVLIPSLFVAFPAVQAISTNMLPRSLSGSGVWGDFWRSLVLSYSLGAVVTILNVIIGLPMAIAIARKKLSVPSRLTNWAIKHSPSLGRVLEVAQSLPTTIMDLLVNVPLIVPSIALGVSLAIFWKQEVASVPEIFLLVLAHLAITYPYFVRSMSAAVERISLDMEEASRTLGARPLGVFRTIILPLTKYSVFSGAIMVFTRSVSETGATLAVTSLRTAPVVIVGWVNSNLPEVSLGCGYLILFSFIILLASRFVVKGKGRY
jgi:thiamine transport system permease protein